MGEVGNLTGESQPDHSGDGILVDSFVRSRKAGTLTLRERIQNDRSVD